MLGTMPFVDRQCDRTANFEFPCWPQAVFHLV